MNLMDALSHLSLMRGTILILTLIMKMDERSSDALVQASKLQNRGEPLNIFLEHMKWEIEV